MKSSKKNNSRLYKKLIESGLPDWRVRKILGKRDVLDSDDSCASIEPVKKYGFIMRWFMKLF